MEIKHIFMLTLFVVTIVIFAILYIYNSSLEVKSTNRLNPKTYTPFSKITNIFAGIIILLSIINFGLSLYSLFTSNYPGNFALSLLAAICSFIFFIGGLLIINYNYKNKKPT